MSAVDSKGVIGYFFSITIFLENLPSIKKRFDSVMKSESDKFASNFNLIIYTRWCLGIDFI